MNQKAPETACIGSGCYPHPELGTVRVSVRGNSRRVSARWVGPEVHVNVPRELRVDDYLSIMSRFEPQLLASRPRPFHYTGRRIETPYFSIAIIQSTIKDGGFNILRGKQNHGALPSYIISVPEKYTAPTHIGRSEVQAHINSLVCRIAEFHAREVLPARARQLASNVSRTPLAWKIGQGRRTLGSCSSNGVITLSLRLMFLPEHLRDYVILHEIAHLSEMNHSSRFHELCNSYCAGREAELVRELKAFRFPVF